MIMNYVKKILSMMINFIISLFTNKEMNTEHINNKEQAHNKLQKLSMNMLYYYVFKNINLNDYTEDGLYELLDKCDKVTKQARLKIGNYKKNKLYREIMDPIDVNKLNESELEQLYIKLVHKSEEIRIKLKQKELIGPVNEFVL